MGLDVPVAGPVGGGGVEAAVEVGVGREVEVVGWVGAGGYEDGCAGGGVGGCVGGGRGEGGGDGGVGGGGRAGGGGVVAGGDGDVEDAGVGVEVDGGGLGAGGGGNGGGRQEEGCGDAEEDAASRSDCRCVCRCVCRCAGLLAGCRRRRPDDRPAGGRHLPEEAAQSHCTRASRFAASRLMPARRPAHRHGHPVCSAVHSPYPPSTNCIAYNFAPRMRSTTWTVFPTSGVRSAPVRSQSTSFAMKSPLT